MQKLLRQKINKRRRRRNIQRLIFTFCFVAGILFLTINITGKAKTIKFPEKKTELKEEEKETDLDEKSNEVSLSKITWDKSIYIYHNDQKMLSQLKERMNTDVENREKLQFIIKNQGAYPPEMIEFLVKYEEVLDFVLKYPEEIRKKHSSIVDISEDYVKGSIPTFIQWDERWGYLHYGDNVIGDSGCGPCCLSMAATALTGKTQYTPAALCRFAENNGYYVDGVGTAWDLMLGGAQKLGLSSENIHIEEDSIKRKLEEGKLVILSMGPGIFTKGGHFILVYKYENGKFYVKDPNSRIRTDKGYTYEEFGSQIKNGWAVWNGSSQKKISERITTEKIN